MSNLDNLAKFNINNRIDLQKSTSIGCGYCLTSDIVLDQLKDWWGPEDPETGLGMTGVCPNCGIDSLIGSFSIRDRPGVEINLEFLKTLHEIWFREVTLEEFSQSIKQDGK